MVFTFAGKPGYQQFDFYRYNVAVVPQHIFKSYTHTDIATGNLERHEEDRRHRARTRTSPASAPSSETVVWKKRSDWWATKALGLNGRADVRRRHQERHERRRAVEPARRQHRPVQQLRAEVGDQGQVQDVLQRRPYHLGANTTWLFPNTTKKPLNDRQFRRALAFSINMDQILDKAYQGLVNKASPTGLLPIWDKWIDKKVVKKYGFSYNVAKAKKILAAAGYKDTNGDGYVENKDGSQIDLEHRLPERVVGLDDRRSR